MYHVFNQYQIALAVAAMLVSSSMLSWAMAEDIGRTVPRSSDPPAWYRVWNDLDGTSETNRMPDAPAPRRVEPEMKEPVNAGTSGSHSNSRGDWQKFANLVEVAQPKLLVTRLQRPVPRAPSSTGSREVSPRRAAKFTPLASQPQNSAQPTAQRPEQDLVTYVAFDAALVIQPQETERQVALGRESRQPREIELGLSEAKPNEKPAAAQPAPLSEDDRTEELKTAIGPTSAPATAEAQLVKLRDIEPPRLLTLAEPARDEPLKRREAGPIRPSQPAEPTANIQLDVAALHRLRLDDPIDRVEIADQQVCVALNHADREINVLAKRNGETTLTIHFTTPRASKVYAVKVGSFNKRQDQVASDLQLQTLIGGMFPESDITLTSTNRSLIASGVVSNNAEAVRVLSFLRRVRLIPVVDKLTVPR